MIPNISNEETFSNSYASHRFALGKEYQKLEKIGEGSYGCVFKVKEISSDKIYAIKVIKTKSSVSKVPRNAMREISLLKSLNHKNIIKLEGYCMTDSKIEICLEYCETDLNKFISINKENSDVYNIDLIKSFLRQILSGVNYLHTRRIMHRDLKPGNLLVSDNLIKITDFGLSKKFSLLGKVPLSKDVSTLWYRAPELLLGYQHYSIGVDVWSIGCIFGELLAKRPLFYGENEIELLTVLFQVFGTFNEEMLPGIKYFPNFKEDFPKHQPYGLSNFVKRITNIELDEAGFDLLSKLLEIDPVKRISCKEALEHVSLFFNNFSHF